MTEADRSNLEPAALLATAACDPDALRANLYTAKPLQLRHATADLAEASVALLYKAGLSHRQAMDLIAGYHPDD
mgnify:CR=1 FL=1